MEVLRFGSSIPGEYWGCCGGNIIQNFKQMPDTPASIQLVEGDSGNGIMEGCELAFLGPTLEDIFWQRLRVSTFGSDDMPNQFFIAVLEDSQMKGEMGRAWLKLLKKAGFEFIRSVDNSVYTGPNLYVPTENSSEPTLCDCGDPDCTFMSEGQTLHLNHIFGLFRNIGGAINEDPFTPPKEWTDLPTVMSETWTFLEPALRQDITKNQQLAHTNIWNETGPTKILRESEVVALGAPVIMAGKRTSLPPQLKAKREETQALVAKSGLGPSDGTQFGLYGQKTLTPPVPVKNEIPIEL